MLYLLTDQFDSEEVLVILHDLVVAVLIIHVDAVLTVFDHILELVLGDLQKVQKSLILAYLRLREDRGNDQADDDDGNDRDDSCDLCGGDILLSMVLRLT